MRLTQGWANTNAARRSPPHRKSPPPCRAVPRRRRAACRDTGCCRERAPRHLSRGGCAGRAGREYKRYPTADSARHCPAQAEVPLSVASAFCEAAGGERGAVTKQPRGRLPGPGGAACARGRGVGVTPLACCFQTSSKRSINEQ